jgi:hypothetical protein
MRLAIGAFSPPTREHTATIWERATSDERAIRLTAAAGRRPREAIDTWLVASYADHRLIAPLLRPGNHGVYMEHGVGIQWHARLRVIRILEYCRNGMVMMPNEFFADKWRAMGAPDVRVVGTPKMDRLMALERETDGQTVAVSLHWTGVLRQRRTTIEQWRKAFAELATQPDIRVLGHAHPSAMRVVRPLYERLGIEVVPDFEDVVRRADVYAVDHSSTMYEAAALRIPVIPLSRKLYDRTPIQAGFRVAYPPPEPVVQADFIDAVRLALKDPEAFRFDVSGCYPYLGHSTEVALEALRSIVPNKRPAMAPGLLSPEPSIGRLMPA